MISFRPALREKTPLMIGLAGPSRSGKTFSALRIATGLAQGGPIAFIDTESGRALQYATRFTYMHGELSAPFSAERYAEAIRAAVSIKPAVIICDSFSHLHEGPGGILEQHDTELERMAGQDWNKRAKMTFSAWIKPKASVNKLVNEILQTPVHFIFCFRAKDKLKLEKGKDPVSLGWTPIITDRFEYECSFLLVLPEGSQGRPDLNAISSGLRDPFQDFIKPGVQLDEALGTKLAEWAAGGAPKQAATSHAPAGDGLSDQQWSRVFKIAEQAGHEEDVVKQWMRHKYGKAAKTAIPASEYGAVCDRLASRAALTAELVEQPPDSAAG